MRHIESQLQKNCLTWFKLQFPSHVIHSIPNGGRRGKIEAAIMKAEGVLAGCADLFVMASSGFYNGLYIEMKTEKGRQTNSQKWFEKKATDFGYKYAVCRSFDEFKKTIEEYLK